VAVVHAEDVDAEHALEVGGGEVEEGFYLGDAGVCDPVRSEVSLCYVFWVIIWFGGWWATDIVFRGPSSDTLCWTTLSTSLITETSPIATVDFLPSCVIS